MRFNIRTHIVSSRAFLPIDYQYALASAVYRLIARGDEAYSRFLHDEGYSPGGLKRFKLFCFGPLALPRYTLWKDKGIFELHERELSFTVSFMADTAAEAFIKGMFTDQRLSIGDRFTQLDMEVTSVEAVSPPVFRPVMRYRCVSPLVITLSEPGKKHETYLPPDDGNYEERFIQNLVAKCAALDTLINDHEREVLGFRLLGNYRSKLVTIKPWTEAATKVRGFMYDFELTAPEYMHEMGYYAGFGMNNGMGFGAVRANQSR